MPKNTAYILVNLEAIPRYTSVPTRCISMPPSCTVCFVALLHSCDSSSIPVFIMTLCLCSRSPVLYNCTLLVVYAAHQWAMQPSRYWNPSLLQSSTCRNSHTHTHTHTQTHTHTEYICGHLIRLWISQGNQKCNGGVWQSTHYLLPVKLTRLSSPCWRGSVVLRHPICEWKCW